MALSLLDSSLTIKLNYWSSLVRRAPENVKRASFTTSTKCQFCRGAKYSFENNSGKVN
jgi:hypothetical protein